MTAEFEHVSDTALLVAASRARETERPDGLVRDPFAARLAGERGMALAESMAVGAQWMNFGIGLRSYFIDELLRLALSRGVNTVLNLGAGLDTRPWRLELPRELRWIEVDFPAMLDYKAGLLADEAPRCRLERASADLNNQAERRRVLDLASTTSAVTLLIAEGLLMYLPVETLRATANEAIATGAFRFWLFDVTSPYLQRIAHGGRFDRIENLRAGTHLEGEDILKLLSENGWAAAEHRGWMKDGWKVGEHRILELVNSLAQREEAPPSAPPADDISGVWLYEPKR
jgi:methyltransferase (TIGR00027 family)